MIKSASIKTLPQAASKPVQQFLDSTVEQAQSIGAILVERGDISLAQASIIIDAQRMQYDLFGVIAVKLGYCDVSAINQAIAMQSKTLHIQSADRSRLAAHIQKILADSRLCSQAPSGSNATSPRNRQTSNIRAKNPSAN